MRAPLVTLGQSGNRLFVSNNQRCHHHRHLPQHHLPQRHHQLHHHRRCRHQHHHPQHRHHQRHHHQLQQQQSPRFLLQNGNFVLVFIDLSRFLMTPLI